MGWDDLTRRRLLAGVGVAGAGGFAGCAALFAENPDYSCTDVDDEATERVTDTPLPFAFDVPEVMEREEVFDRNNQTRVTYTQRWKQPNPGSGRDTLNHSVDLQVKQVGTNLDSRPMLSSGREPVPEILGKRRIDGSPVALIGRDLDGTEATIELYYPTTVDGERVYRRTSVESEALIQGSQYDNQDARSDDPDQTCGEAMREVATAVVDSVSTIEPAQTETELSLTAAADTVARGESVDLTVEASGVEWVDLLIDGETGEDPYTYRGVVGIGNDPVTVTMTPSTDRDVGGVVTAPDGVQLDTLTSTDETRPGSYSVLVRAADTEGLIDATTMLTVEPA